MSKEHRRSTDPRRIARASTDHPRRVRHKKRPCGSLPAAPAGVTLTFSTVERERFDRIRARVRWEEVSLDTAGIGERIARYVVLLQRSDDGITWTDDPRRVLVEAKDEDADTLAHALFHGIRRRYWYRARVRAVNKDGCRSAWSAWTAGATPADTTPPPDPTNVTIFPGATNRVAIDWDTPTDPADADLPHPDVAYFQAQISTSPTFATIYKFDRYQVITKRSFKVAAADEGSTFYARVRSVDSSGNKSNWIPATTAGNSLPGTPADGVVIGKGAGRTKHMFSIRGRLRTLAETDVHDLEIDEDLTLRKVRCRLKEAILGAALTIRVYRNNTILAATVTIAAGTKRGVTEGLAVAFADGDNLSLDVTVGTGATFPGRHLTTVCVFD